MAPTIISTWIPVVLRTYAFYGHDPAKLLKEAGIDEALMSRPEARIPITAYNTLWRLAVAHTGDPCMGLRVAPFLRPTTFHALGVALLASHTIGNALERLARHYPLISDEVGLHLAAWPGWIALCFTPYPDAPLPAGASVDAFMAVTLTYARLLDDENLNPLQVDFMHPRPPDIRPFEKFFKSPVRFGASDNRICFRVCDVNRPLPAANAEIALKNDQIVTDYLVRYTHARLEDRVRQSIVERLPSGEPSADDIARSLGMSVRSLSRYLHRRQTSLRGILDDTRCRLAYDYLRLGSLSILEVAFRLGYTDSSNFSRAFKRWYGVSPSLFREQMLPSASIGKPASPGYCTGLSGPAPEVGSLKL